MIKKELAAYSRVESLDYPEVLTKKLIFVDLDYTLTIARDLSVSKRFEFKP